VGARELLLIRHAESTANVAGAAVEGSDAETVEMPVRDADVPLTDYGRDQASAIAAWLQSLPDDEFPDAVWSSPYLRVFETARLGTASQRTRLPIRIDERLRDRETGILEGLTTRGIEARLPAEAARRRRVGKFYYRPPGGESWADVTLRSRSILADLDRQDASRVLIFSHDTTILTIHAICGRLMEGQILELERAEPLANASITHLVLSDAGDWSVAGYNSVEHLRDLQPSE
jgi:broad specificity phosphatase PhoE